MTDARALLLTLAESLSAVETPLLTKPLMRASPICVQYHELRSLSRLNIP